MTAAAAVAKLKPKRHEHILVNGKKIHLRFVQQIAWSVVGAAVGAYIVSALYYIITQVKYPGVGGHTALYLKPGWDHLFSQSWWPAARHDVRDVYEGVFATLLIKSIVSKRKYWGQKVATWRVATAPLVVALAALPVVALGIWFVDIHHTTLPSSIHTYQAYLIGFVAAQVVHRVYAPIGNTVQLFFVEEMVSRDWTPKWPLPPVVRERYAWIKEECGVLPEKHGNLARIVLPVMATGMLALAAYGAYIRFVIAKGH
jgi:hypothetical protein